MSKWEQVANILGLELGERFCITSMNDIRFFFTKDGLDVDNGEDMNLDYILFALLSDKMAISKLYYIPSFSPYGYERVDLLSLDKSLVDKYKRYKLLCDSVDEAKNLTHKILHKISRDEIGA